MRITLPAFPLASTRPHGGVESYWRSLVPALLKQADEDLHFHLLSAFLRPRALPVMEELRGMGAVVHHWWLRSTWLEGLSRVGGRLEWFAGSTDLLHLPEPGWRLPTRGRLVLTCHDLLFLHHPQSLHPAWAKRLLEGVERAREEATLWICDSEATRGDLVESCQVPRARTVVVHLGVDEAFRAADRERARDQAGGEPYFLFLGSLEPKKNLPMLLRAFGRAGERGLQSRLIVAGRESWQSAGLRTSANGSTRESERVAYRGFVPREELPTLVAGARALVLPSRLEGFGLPVVEAMAAGAPVLCSDRGSLPEIAGGAAKLFDPDDEDGLVELLLELEESEETRERMREAGRRRAAEFSWNRCAAETLAAYRLAMDLPR